MYISYVYVYHMYSIFINDKSFSNPFSSLMNLKKGEPDILIPVGSSSEANCILNAGRLRQIKVLLNSKLHLPGSDVSPVLWENSGSMFVALSRLLRLHLFHL